MSLITDTSSQIRRSRKITDWVLHDDRIFIRDITLDEPDDMITDAYLTIKADPTSDDSASLLQKHVTATPSSSGLILDGEITINILGSELASALATIPYYFDIEILTSKQRTLTIEVGTINFVQDVTGG